MPIRLVAIDLDGTLLNSQSQLSPANVCALQEALARDVHVVVVTGRRFPSARRILDQLPFPVMLIASNGAMIGASSGEVLHQNFLPRAGARSVLKLAGDYRSYAVAIFDTAGRGQVVMQEEAAADSPLNWYLVNSPEALLQFRRMSITMPRLTAHQWPPRRGEKKSPGPAPSSCSSDHGSACMRASAR